MSKHLGTEMDSLRQKVISLTTLIEDLLQSAVKCLRENDVKLAKEVTQRDNEVDSKEVEIEEDCLKILALHQPVAIDLRYLIGVLKMNNDLERIGDLTVNIAERTLFLQKYPPIDPPFDLDTMTQKAVAMLKKAIDALVKMDINLAKEVCLEDQIIDDINKEMYSKVFAAIKENPNNVEALIQYLAASRYIERIADFITNIAEDVIYMVDGTIVRHNPELYEE